MPRNQRTLTLPEPIDELIDSLAEKGGINRSEVVRQAVLALAVIVSNNVDSASYIASVRLQFRNEVR